MKALHRIIAPVAAGFLLVGTLGAPADANVRKFRDKRGDTRGSIDIRKIRVDNAKRRPHKVIVRVKQRRFEYGDYIYIYFDTKKRNRGPEYRMRGYYGSEYYMERMKRWKKRGRTVRCRGDRYSLKLGGPGRGVSRAVVHRKCLGKPGRVRVAIKTGREGRGRDWARAKHRWLGWVKR